MLVSITGQQVRNWQYGGTRAFLRIFADQDFVTSDGEIIKAGSPGKGKFFREVELAVNGTILTIPTIANFATTTDSPNRPSASYTFYFFDSKRSKKDIWLAGQKIPHTHGNPLNYPDIISFNDPPGPQPNDSAISYNQAVLLMQGLAAQIGGLTLATGLDNLNMAATTTVFNSHVSVSAAIVAIPKDDRISGNLHISNRVDGVSFDVASDNGADLGTFKWMIYA